MSTFTPGTTGFLSSTNIPAAFFEVSRILGSNENTRNAANTGVSAVNNITVNLNLDSGVASIAATIPIIPTLSASGVPTITAKDYLGTAFSNFVIDPVGDVKSTNSISAFLEIAQILASAEKSITPLESQPNNIQITYDLEAGSATVSANLPFTSTSAAGQITIVAFDYL